MTDQQAELMRHARLYESLNRSLMARHYVEAARALGPLSEADERSARRIERRMVGLVYFDPSEAAA